MASPTNPTNRFNRRPSTAAMAGNKGPEVDLKESLPKPPKARSIVTLGRIDEVEPIWLSGQHNKIDVLATMEAIDLNLLPALGTSADDQRPRIGIPDYTTEGQLCVLAGPLGHRDKIQFRNEFGIDIRYQVRKLLDIQTSITAFFSAVQKWEKDAAEARFEVNRLYQVLEQAQQKGDQEEAAKALQEYEAGFRDYKALTSKDLSAELGVYFHDNGSVSTVQYPTPVFLTEEYINLTAFILSRWGKITGVTEEWFKRVQEGGYGAFTPSCFQLQAIAQGAIADYIEESQLFIPATITSPIAGEEADGADGEDPSETAFFTILRLAHLYNPEQILKTLVDKGDVSSEEEEEINKKSPFGEGEKSPKGRSKKGKSEG